MTPKNNQPMNRINKIILCGLLLCLLGAAGKGYGQDVVQTITLKKGWNLVSFYVEASDMSPGTVFAPISSKLIQIKNLTSSYDPSIPAFLNTLSRLDVKDGYWVKVSEATSFELEGSEPEGASIPVRTGWNIVGYPSPDISSVKAALDGVSVVLIQSISESYNPVYPAIYNTLEYMTPGSGYWLKVSADGILDFSSDQPVLIFDQEISQHSDPFGDVNIYTSVFATLYGQVTLDGGSRLDGDVVAVYVGNELRGKSKIKYNSGKSYTSLNINVAGGTENCDFVLWDSTTEKELSNTLKTQLSVESRSQLGTSANPIKLDFTSSVDNFNQTGPVVIINHPKTSVVTQYNLISLSVNATGEYPLSYQWLLNSKQISGATEKRFIIDNAKLVDSGNYSVKISNNHGEVFSNEAVVKVKKRIMLKIFADDEDVIDSVVRGDKAEITLSTLFEGGAIFYTLDGSEPSFESTLYDEPFTVSKTTGIRAVAYKKDFSDLYEADPVFINIVPNYALNVSIEGQGAVVKDPADGPYMQDSVVKLKAVPEEGWRFVGWSGALKSSFEEGSVVMASWKSVTAAFQAIPKYYLNFSAGGGADMGHLGITAKSVLSENIHLPVMGLHSYYQGTEVTIKAHPDNGWIFSHWSGDISGKQLEMVLTVDSSKEVKTVEPIFGTHLETTATGNGQLLIDPLEGLYPYGSNVKITPIPDAGYYLGVWGGDALGMEKGPIEYEITKANPEITALFVPLKENRFTVTTLASSGGSVVSNPNSNAYVNGQQVTLTATPEPGYSFVGWTGDIESTVNPLVTLADANKTVTAQFRRNIIAPVTLTINAENGTVTRTPSDELYEKGTNVELLAQANPGYTFTGWAGALGVTASRATLFLDGDKVVTANFKASYQLTSETRGPGSVLTTPSSNKFIDGDEVILTASPAEGYGFVGWTGDLESTDQQTTLSMDSNKRVIAHFAQLGTLTTWSRGEGTITRSPDKESYFPGASVTLTATPGDGFQFVNWDGQASGTKNPTTVTMDRAMSVAANFKDIKAPPVTITSPASQETADEVFTLSGGVQDNGSIKTLLWLWRGEEMGELELVDGKFSLKDQKLVGGPNDITVVATDRSGNEGKATATPTWVADRSIRIATATEQQEGNRIEVPIEINSKGDVGGMGFVLNYNHSYLMDPEFTWSSAAGGSINLVNEDVAG
ncbi:chitobiase/beta-hexosaminidase C-terminal domain-containing protein, partial [bacterium]|nr:chitobiase/beta-hexosaminidase C-terminal domain-containing protein [bacterium]